MHSRRWFNVHLHRRHLGLSRWHLVQLPSSRDRAAATRAQVTALYLRGRRCTAAPNAPNRPTTHIPEPLLHCVRRLRASLALYVALLTEQARGGVRQGSEREPGTEDRREQAPVLCARAMASDHTQSRELATTPALAPTKTR